MHDNADYVNREAMVEAVKQLRGDGGGEWQMGYERAQTDVLALLGAGDTFERINVSEPRAKEAYDNPTMGLENAISMVTSLRRLIVCHHDDYEMVKAAVAGHPHVEVKASSLTVKKGRAYIIDPSALEELVDLAMGM